VRKSYSQLEKRPPKLYIVTVINKTEEAKLNNNIDNFIIFTTFTKGFTSEKEAKKAQKAR
jgi:hypothetical protein